MQMYKEQNYSDEEYYKKEDYNYSQGMKTPGGMKPAGGMCGPTTHNNHNMHGGYGGQHEGYNSQYSSEEFFEEEKRQDNFAGKNDYSLQAGNKLHMSANKYSAPMPNSVGAGYGSGPAHHGAGYGPGQAHHGYGPEAHHGGGYGHHGGGSGGGFGGSHGGGYGGNHHRPNVCEQKPVWVSRGLFD